MNPILDFLRTGPQLPAIEEEEEQFL